MTRIDLQPQRLDICIVRGDTLRLKLTLTEQESGAALDLAGKEVFASAKPIDRTDAEVVPMDVTITDNNIQLFMTAEQTRLLGAKNRWDVSLVDANDSRTILQGHITAAAEVSGG